MTDQHPITPPPELIKEWRDEWFESDRVASSEYVHIATQAARWGADQELEAWCDFMGPFAGAEIRAARRPKPPSLKQQALEALQRAEEDWQPIPDDCDTIRRALESLPD